MIVLSWVLLSCTILVSIAFACVVRTEVKRMRALDRIEEQRLVGVPKRNRIDRHPGTSDRPQVPHQSDGGRP